MDDEASQQKRAREQERARESSRSESVSTHRYLLSPSARSISSCLCNQGCSFPAKEICMAVNQPFLLLILTTPLTCVDPCLEIIQMQRKKRD